MSPTPSCTPPPPSRPMHTPSVRSPSEAGLVDSLGPGPLTAGYVGEGAGWGRGHIAGVRQPPGGVSQ